VFCFERGVERGRDTPLAEIRRLLRQASAVVDSVVFMGAETTLHPEFLRAVELARELGLRPLASTNLERFADVDFLQRCLAAGLGGVEFSFHYPDEESYRAQTRSPAAGWARLLEAMRNVEAHNRALPRGPSDPRFLGVVANVVPNACNQGRLAQALGLLDELLPQSLLAVTFKRLQGESLGRGGGDLPPEHRAVPDALRTELLSLIRCWSGRAAAPVLRGFPLCAVPGHEHLNADLLYLCRRATVMQNFGRRPQFLPMHAPPVGKLPPVDHPVCTACRLNRLCRLASPREADGYRAGFSPRPSARDPADVLRCCPLGAPHPLGLRATEIRAFLTRLDQLEETKPPGAEPPDAPAVPAATQDLAATLEALLAPGGPRPTFAGFVVTSVAPLLSSQVQLTLQSRDDELILRIEPRAGAGPFFAEAGDLAVSYAAETPLTRGARCKAVERLVAFLKGRAGRPRARSHPLAPRIRQPVRRCADAGQRAPGTRRA